MAATRHVTPFHRAPILDRLATEWQCLTVRAAELDIVRRWSLPGGDVCSLDDVLVRTGYLPRPVPGSPRPSVGAPRADRHQHDTAPEDSYLLRLLTIARHDQLAARIVLQRILPSLSAMARRHSTDHGARQDLLDDLVANSWASIRSYPIERRPRRVVSNLVRDIGFQTIVRPVRRRAAAELPTANDDLRERPVVTDVDPLEELADLLADARHQGMSQDDIDLICEIVRGNHPSEVASRRQVTSRTVRNHRDAIVHRLRTIALTAA